MFVVVCQESVARKLEFLTVGPFSAMRNTPLQHQLFLACRYEEIISTVIATQAWIPKYSIRGILALVYWAQGFFDKAPEEERLELDWRGDSRLKT